MIAGIRLFQDIPGYKSFWNALLWCSMGMHGGVQMHLISSRVWCTVAPMSSAAEEQEEEERGRREEKRREEKGKGERGEEGKKGGDKRGGEKRRRKGKEGRKGKSKNMFRNQVSVWQGQHAEMFV